MFKLVREYHRHILSFFFSKWKISHKIFNIKLIPYKGDHHTKFSIITYEMLL